MLRDLRALRFVVTISMLAWLAATNHCVFSANLAQSAPMHDGMPVGCPMHQQQNPQPEKQNDCGDVPCCKILRATATASAPLVSKPIWLGALITFFKPSIPETKTEATKFSRILDTGPPGENSFAESVLQRSILAHAPPLSLS